MVSYACLQQIGNALFVGSFVIFLCVNILLTIKNRFIQFRLIPKMFSLLSQGVSGNKNKTNTGNTIPAYQALFTAMSTTIGIGNIVGPVVAIKLGGPGALASLLIALLFGAATTFAEVTFALHYRTQRPDGTYAGGAMQYISKTLGNVWAHVYAYSGAALLIVWSANQSNSLADIATQFSIPRPLTGAVMTVLVLSYLMAGIKHISKLASKIVPFMFVTYCGSCIWVIASNIDKLGSTLSLIFWSALSPEAMGGAAAGFTVQKALRWGLAKGIHSGEAGIATAAIPHSQAQVINPVDQGIISMISAYSVAFISALSGLAVLMTGIWQNPDIPVGINMVSYAFAQHIPTSTIFLTCSIFLFALGTILGNAYNGSQCFGYITNNRWYYWYYTLAAGVVFWGSFLDVEFIWSISDYFIIPMAFPNIIAIMYLSFTRADLLKES